MTSPARMWTASVVHWIHSFATVPAPGGTAADDSPSMQRRTGRLVAFSDAIFAFTVTLLVLAIKTPTDFTNLGHGLVALWPSYLAYALTFLFIGQVWVNHHVMFDHIRVANRVVLFLNTLLLMVVAFLPFATSVLAGALRSGDGLKIAVFFYAISFDATAITYNAVWRYARHKKLVNETIDPAGAKAISRRFGLALALLTMGVLLGLVVPFLGVAMVAAFNVIYWLPIRGESPRDPGAISGGLPPHTGRSGPGEMVEPKNELRRLSEQLR
jgi:uncharacterized membrane protein